MPVIRAQKGCSRAHLSLCPVLGLGRVGSLSGSSPSCGASLIRVWNEAGELRDGMFEPPAAVRLGSGLAPGPDLFRSMARLLLWSLITQTVHFHDPHAEYLEPVKESTEGRLILKRAMQDGLDRPVVCAEMLEVSKTPRRHEPCYADFVVRGRHCVSPKIAGKGPGIPNDPPYRDPAPHPERGIRGRAPHVCGWKCRCPPRTAVGVFTPAGTWPRRFLRPSQGRAARSAFADPQPVIHSTRTAARRGGAKCRPGVLG